jgi:hypothetical protein
MWILNGLRTYCYCFVTNYRVQWSELVFVLFSIDVVTDKLQRAGLW